MPAVFITGTDTDVGKSVVCGLLAGYLRQRGASVVTQKWIQTGQDRDLCAHAHWAGGEDASWAHHAEDRNPLTYALPASPHLAARQDGKTVALSCMRVSCERLCHHFDWVLVEGIGGLLVPLDEKNLVVDVACDLDLPVLVVVANRLGAINHSLLTVEALRRRQMRILGLVFNEVPEQHPAIAADNPHIVAQHTDLPVWGPLPRTRDVVTLQGAFEPVGHQLWTNLGART